MELSKTTLLSLAFLGLAVLLAFTASADPGLGDTWEEAVDIYDDSQETHTVSAAGGGNPADDDWFRIALTEGQVLNIGMIYTPDNGAAGMIMYGPDSHTRRFTWDLRTDINALEIDSFIHQNGTYYVKVFVRQGGTSVPYGFLVHVRTPPVLRSGQQVNNNAEPLWARIDSSRWYRIMLEGGNVSSEICEVTLSWTGDYNIHLYAYDRKNSFALNVLNYSVSRSTDRVETLRFAASYTGYYYIRAATWDPITQQPTPTFTLSATILGSKYRTDGNVQRSDAEFIDIRKTVNGKLDQAYDTHEWYTFYLNEDEQFSAKASVTNSMLTVHRDFYNLTLYSENGTVLTFGINQGSTGDPIFSCSIFIGRAPYTGRYYMSFSAMFSQSGVQQTDHTNGKLVNTCRFEIDVLIPNRRVWIVDPPAEIRMDEDTERTLDLTKYFWDPEGDELTFGTIGGKDNFTLVTIQSTGKLTMRPDENWYGQETIQIWAHDGRPDQKNLTKVIITVRSVPDPPYTKGGAPRTVRIWEDEINTTALNLYDVFGDVDIEDKFLMFSSDKNEFVNVDIDQTSGRVNLFGEDDYNGQQTITFWAADSYNFREDHQITIIVRPVNDPPVSVGKIPRITMLEGANSHIDVGPYFEDIDEDDELYYYAEWDQEDAIAFDNAESNPINSWFDIYPEDRDFFGFVQVIFICYDRDPGDPKAEPEEARQSAILEVENVNDPPRVDVWEPDNDQPEISELEAVTFKVPEDKIYDVDSTTFRWKWFVNDVEQVDVSGEAFTFPPDPTYDDSKDSPYTIRCEVKDSLGLPANLNPEWVLTILDTNRAPTVNLITTDMEIEEGSTIRLRADGYDQDEEDTLEYTWFRVDDNGVEHKIGFGRDFAMEQPLSPGSYRFRVMVSDEEAEVRSDYIQVDVSEKKFPPTIPGFGAVLAAAALTASLVAVGASRRRD